MMLEVTGMAASSPADIGFARWAHGYGVIHHTAATRARVRETVARVGREGASGDGTDPWELLHALDRMSSAAMWLVVHETYARNVYLDARRLETADFKPRPEGHTGGALNIVPAYAGYLAAKRSPARRAPGSWGKAIVSRPSTPRTCSSAA
jgi:hypothetical protein